MPDTGFKTCGTVEFENWTGTFTTTQINISDNIRAQTILETYQDADISDFAFGIPSGATINGIEAQAEFSANDSGTTAFIRLSLSWNDGTNWTATKENSVLGLTDQTKTYGGASDTWGRAWSASEFADGTFRMKVEGRSNYAGYACRLDYVAVKVYYTEGGGTQNSAMFLVF